MNKVFDLKAYLEEKRALVEEALEQCLPKTDSIYKPIVNAMRYSLFAGGKKLRPILCLTATETVGGDLKVALPAACALELIHTYSLIHDDLPAMDNDDLRRGKPASHKVFGDALAILAGDALLTEAFYLLTHPRLAHSIPNSSLITIVHLIAEASGFRGMVGGQVMDLEATGKKTNAEELETMDRHKTGALIAASVESGAILGGGTKDQIKALSKYGHHIGLAFQIVDDILDIEGTTIELGKQANVDQEKKKSTYPSIMGLNRAKELALNHTKQAINALEKFGKEAEPLRAIAYYIKDRRY